MLTFRFMILFWVATRIDVHVLMRKNHIISLILSCATACLPPLSEAPSL